MLRIGADRAADATVLSPVIALPVSSQYETYHWTPRSVVGLALVPAGNIVVFIRWSDQTRLQPADTGERRTGIAMQAQASGLSGVSRCCRGGQWMLDPVSITVPDIAMAGMFHDAIVVELGVARVGSDQAGRPGRKSRSTTIRSILACRFSASAWPTRAFC